MWIFGKKYNLNDLEKYRKYKIERSKFKILIIDDDDITYDEELKAHDFHYRHVSDIESIDYTSEYQIVICDIKGVGKKFKSKYEGAHIIEEIDKVYPNKIKIVYTGNEFDIRYNKFFELCDYKIHKDDDFDTWIEILDDAIAKVSDPIDQWKRIRDRLIKNDVPLYDIFLIEQDYIKSMLKKKKHYLTTSKPVMRLNEDLKQVVLGIISNGVYNIIVG